MVVNWGEERGEGRGERGEEGEGRERHGRMQFQPLFSADQFLVN